MKKNILNISLAIALISLFVMIALLICLLFPFDVETKAVLMFLASITGSIFGFSLVIIILIGAKNSKWGDDLH